MDSDHDDKSDRKLIIQEVATTEVNFIPEEVVEQRQVEKEVDRKLM
jgi:hypothetical protein